MILMLDKNDPQVKQFREQVYTDDLGLPLEYMNYGLNKLKQRTDNALPDEVYENAYKLSNVKWDKEDIDKVWLMPGVAISCGVIHDSNRYRGGYLTYTLKAKRQSHRSVNFKEFGFLARQCIRAIELDKEELFLTVYEYNRRMKAQVRAFKHKGYAEAAGNILHQDLEYQGLENIAGVDQHVFTIKFYDQYKKYDEHLMELKTKETTTIEAKYPTDPRKYPDVVKICEVDVDPLIKDLNNFSDNENYLLTRRKDFVISPSINAIVSNYLGFKGDVYESVPLNKRNSTQLKDSVGEDTVEFLNKFIGAERVNYVTTRKGWKTKPHADHEDYTKQGFRIIVPLTGPMKMTFDGEREYIFEPGFAYFANVCVQHVGEHHATQNQRTGILFKLNKDDLIWQACSSV
jgi:hypothetical protein